MICEVKSMEFMLGEGKFYGVIGLYNEKDFFP